MRPTSRLGLRLFSLLAGAVVAFAVHNASAGWQDELGRLLGIGDKHTIPPPHEALRFDAQAQGPERLRLNWQIHDEAYLYRDEIKISLQGEGGTALGEYQLPNAVVKENAVRPDGSTGRLAVYEESFSVTVPLVRTNTEATFITLRVHFQGCAEIGVCYPPRTEEVVLQLPKLLPSTSGQVAERSATSRTYDSRVSDQGIVLQLLKDSGVFALWASSFGFGVLIAFTACMYPLIPILSSLIVGQGKEVSWMVGLLLSFAYVEGIALTFGVIGAVMGSVGEAIGIQAYFQSAALLIPFVLLFVLLALSMFGFFSIQLPQVMQDKMSRLSRKQKGGSFFGAFVMGALSALIVGPCGGPVLVGELVFAAQSNSPILGFLALFAFGNGIGLPLLVVGAGGGKLLPRAGPWMEQIRHFAGVLLLAVAIMLLERVPTVIPPTVTMICWAVLLVVFGVYLGALEPLAGRGGWKRFRKGVGVVLMVYGVVVLVGGFTGSRSPVDPLFGVRSYFAVGGDQPGEKVHFVQIKNLSELNQALATADGKITLLDFYADWCAYCKTLEDYVFPDPQVRPLLELFQRIKIDITAMNEADRAVMDQLEVVLPPAILFFTPEGRELTGHRIVGELSASELAKRLERVLAR